MTAAPHYDHDDPGRHALRVSRLRTIPGYGLPPSLTVGRPEAIAYPLSATPACAGYDPEIFFDHRTRFEAQRICQQCKVKAECLELAMNFEASDQCVAPWGVFGGTTAQERNMMRRSRATA